MGDSAWEQGEKLLSFKIVPEEEIFDGFNLHIRVKQMQGSQESPGQSGLALFVAYSDVSPTICGPIA